MAPEGAQVERFRRDLARLAPGAERVGVAVSGGADSLALLLLARAALPGAVAAATVDHGLRAGAANEAAFVARVCVATGVPHATLRAVVEVRGEGLQAAARAARYGALAGWCEAVGTAVILTAHHAEDQAETLLMRLARGSGLGGLAGVRAHRPLRPPVDDVRLVRPLLGWRQAELAEIVGAAGLNPVADPANADPRYDRTMARALLAATSWLDPVRIAASAGHLADAEAALAWAAERAWSERASSDGDAVTLDPADLPGEMVRRLVLRAIAILGGPAPDGPGTTRLIESLNAGATASLSGVKAAGGPRWRFAAAPPRRTG